MDDNNKTSTPGLPPSHEECPPESADREKDATLTEPLPADTPTASSHEGAGVGSGLTAPAKHGFKKGNAGRPKGTKNKSLPLNLSHKAPRPEAYEKSGDYAKEVFAALLDSFERLGGVAGLVKFGHKQPAAYYRLVVGVLGQATLLKSAKNSAPVNVTVQNFDDE